MIFLLTADKKILKLDTYSRLGFGYYNKYMNLWEEDNIKKSCKCIKLFALVCWPSEEPKTYLPGFINGYYGNIQAMTPKWLFGLIYGNM
jgi:SUMO ligase MMS21 Smc5/6 complex component